MCDGIGEHQPRFRPWNFAPASYKNQIERKLYYYYQEVHGNLDGLDAVKTQSAELVFSSGTFVISPATTSAETGGVARP